MTFRIGQKVVCVDADGLVGTIIAGAVYEIADVEPRGVRLVDWKCGGGFLASRFRPIVERKTDISVFTEILRKNNIGVDA
jgi:predicted TPR repeat methyltransferase